jgi:hypothetical protein
MVDLTVTEEFYSGNTEGVVNITAGPEEFFTSHDESIKNLFGTGVFFSTGWRPSQFPPDTTGWKRHPVLRKPTEERPMKKKPQGEYY